MVTQDCKFDCVENMVHSSDKQIPSAVPIIVFPLSGFDERYFRLQGFHGLQRIICCDECSHIRSDAFFIVCQGEDEFCQLFSAPLGKS